MTPASTSDEPAELTLWAAPEAIFLIAQHLSVGGKFIDDMPLDGNDLAAASQAELSGRLDAAKAAAQAILAGLVDAVEAAVHAVAIWPFPDSEHSSVTTSRSLH